MRSDTDPDVFLSEVFQFRDELNDLGEAVTDERLTKIYSTVKKQSIRDPVLGLKGILSMAKTIFINHSERSSVPKISQESYRKVRNSGREPISDKVREPAMTLTCNNCKKPGHEMKYYKQLKGKSDKPSHAENGKRKWCSYHHSDGHSNKDYHRQQLKSANINRKKRWCTYHKKSRKHPDD